MTIVNSTTIRVACEWESHWKTNPIKAYINTVKEIITHPVMYFATLAPFEDYVALCLFVYINNFIAVLITFGVQLIFMGSLFTLLQEHLGSNMLIGAFPTVINFVLGVACFPILAVCINFLISGILHVFLVYLGGSEKNYQTTLSVHSLGSVIQVFNIVPILGGLVSMVYFWIITIGGQAKAHEMDTGRAALSVLLPFFLCCCLWFVFVFFIIFMMGGLAAVVGQHH